MKIQLLSDIHLEWSNHEYSHIWESDVDTLDTVLVLAGDIDVGTCSEQFIVDVCDKFKYVVRVLGNHEFYDQEFNRVIEFWRNFEENGPKNFHFLNNNTRILDGVRFIGGTMWTSFDGGNPVVMTSAQYLMSDFELIKHEGYIIKPSFILDQHKSFMKFLIKELETSFDGDTVIVTHHSPGNGHRLGNNYGRREPLYFANIEETVALYSIYSRVRLFLHGHTHRSWDYQIEETRVVCNPYGYWGESVNRNFIKQLILEI